MYLYCWHYLFAPEKWKKIQLPHPRKEKLTGYYFLKNMALLVCFIRVCLFMHSYSFSLSIWTKINFVQMSHLSKSSPLFLLQPTGIPFRKWVVISNISIALSSVLYQHHWHLNWWHLNQKYIWELCFPHFKTHHVIYILLHTCMFKLQRYQ